MRLVSLLGLGGVCLACSSADPGGGADLALRIQGAQLERGSLPEPSGAAEVTFVDWRRTRIRAGEAGVPIAGRASQGSYAVNIGLAGDAGYWIRNVGVEDPTAVGELSWSAGLDFASWISGDAVQLLLQAVDGEGRPGAVRTVSAAVESLEPNGQLVIELSWDTDADLDLYVTEPSGVTIGPKNINAYDPPEPGEPRDDPEAFEQGGMIDVDSNSNCVIDGLRREAATWQSSPPEGAYEVRVDLPALCGAVDPSSYQLVVRLDGEEVKRVAGPMYAADARSTAASGDVGVFVASFTLQNGERR
jgi:hypothetical protein